MKSLLLGSSQSQRADSHVNPILRKRPPSFAMVEQEFKTATIGDLAVKVTAATTAALSLSAASQSVSSSDASSHGEDNQYWLEHQTINQVDLVSARSRKQGGRALEPRQNTRNKSSTKQDSHLRRSRSPVHRYSQDEFEFSKTLMNKASEDGVDKKMLKRNLKGHHRQSKVQSHSHSTKRSRLAKRNKENLWMIYNSMSSTPTSVMGKESNGRVIEENAIKGAGDTHESKSNNPVDGDITSEAHKWAFKMVDSYFIAEILKETVDSRNLHNVQFPETSKWIVDSGIVLKEDEEKLGKIYDALMKFHEESKGSHSSRSALTFHFLMQDKDAVEGRLAFRRSSNALSSCDATYTTTEKLHLKCLLNSGIDSPSINSTHEECTSAEKKMYCALYHLLALMRIPDYKKQLKDRLSSDEDTAGNQPPHDPIMDRYFYALASFLAPKACEEVCKNVPEHDKNEESAKKGLRVLTNYMYTSSLRGRRENCLEILKRKDGDCKTESDIHAIKYARALLPNLEKWENEFRDLLSLVNPGDEYWYFINLVKSRLAERDAMEEKAKREAKDAWWRCSVQ